MVSSSKITSGTFIWQLCAIIALTFTLTSSAQQSTGSVVGTVSDVSGALIPGANVVIEDEGTHETRQMTANDGQYSFTTLKLGTYSLTVTAPGFSSEHISTFDLASGDTRRINVSLKVGATSEKVEVSTAGTLLKTDSSTLDISVPSQTIQELPSIGRNLFVMTQDLVAGANAGTPGSILGGTKPDDRRSSSSISVNGQSASYNEFLIDGLDNNALLIGVPGVRPSIDGVEELHVQTNLYTADVGRTAGAVINVITKSGTNQFHGTLYEYIRNDVFNARDYFALTQPELRQNQFGGSIGGPIIRDKTFFFADYEGLRLVNGMTSTSLVPSLYEEQHPGDLSDIGGPVIPSAQLNPIALNFFKLYPAPNNGQNFTYSPKGTQYAETADTRVDHRFNKTNLFFARYTINQTDTFTPPAFPAVGGINGVGNPNSYPGSSTERQQNLQINYVHIFTPNLLLELKAGFTRVNDQALPLNYGGNYATQLGLVNANLDIRSSTLTPMLIGPYATLGEGNYQPIVDIGNNFQYTGTLSWSHGNQTVRAGASLLRRQFNNFESSQGVGQYTFTGNNVAALTSFLIGNAFQYVRSNQLFSNSYRTWEPNGFIQDDWHVSRNLTLNMGVRYGVITPYTEHHNQLSNFDPESASLIVAGVNGVSKTAGVQVDHSNIAPRIGFSYEPHAGTIIRGGYGISYFAPVVGSHQSLQNAPFTYNYGPITNVSLSAPAPIPVASNPNAPFGTIAGAIDLGFRNAAMNQTSLEVAQQLGATVVSVRYVGDFGTRLPLVFGNIDVPAPSPSTTAANLQSRRPYYSQLPNVTAIQEIYSHGSSSYNALQAEVQRRLTGGLTVISNYTFAHELDNLSISSLVSPQQSSLYDYGTSAYEIRHRVAGAVTYELPILKKSRGVEHLLGAGWQLNAIGRWQTGIPFNITNGAPQINVGVSSDRPNVVGNPNLPHPSIRRFFNAAAFAPQAFGTPGNTPVNFLHGPHQRSVDVSIMKDFPIHEATIMQFRAESFNITNTPSFSVPNSTISSSAVGTITSTNAIARQLQFTFKVIF